MADYKGLNIRWRGDATDAAKALNIIRNEAKAAQGQLSGTQAALDNLATNGKALNDALKQLSLDKLATDMKTAREMAESYAQVLPQLKAKLAELQGQIEAKKIDIAAAIAGSDGTERAALEISSLRGQLNSLEEQERATAAEVERTNVLVNTSASEANAAAAAYQSYANQLAASQTGMHEFAENAKRTGESLQTVGESIASVGDKMSLFSAATVMTFGRSMLSSTEEFGNAISQLGGYLDIGGAQLESMGDLALKFGKDTQFSAGEAAQAMNELAKGGMTQVQIAGGAMDATMQLAAAGELDMASAAETAVQAIKVFGIENENATKVADALAGAANTSTAEVRDLAQGFAQIGGAANMAGWDVNEVTGALALLADRGFSGAEAGTTLKTTLQRLAAPTNKAREAMANLGVDVYDSNGKMVDAIEVVGQFERALQGLSDEDVNKALFDIFGARGINGITALLSQGSEGFQSYIEATERAGYATEMAQSRMNDLGWALEYMRGEVETAVVNFGQALAPTIKDVAEGIESLTGWFNGLSDGQQEFIAKSALMVTAAGPVISILGHLTSGVGGMLSTLGQAAEVVNQMRTNDLNLAGAIAEVITPMDNATKHGVEVAKMTENLERSFQQLATGGAVALALAVGGALVQSFIDYNEHLRLVHDATDGLAEATRNMGEAFDEGGASGLTQSAEQIRDSLDDALQSIAQFGEKIGDTVGEMNTNASMLDHYGETIRELAGKASLSQAEQDKLHDAVSRYNEIAGTSIRVVNEQVGALNVLPEKIDAVTEAYKRQAEQTAYADLYAEAVKKHAENQQELEQTTKDLADAQKRLQENYSSHALDLENMPAKVEALKQKEEELSQAQDALSDNVKHWSDKMDEVAGATSSYDRTLDELGIAAKTAGNNLETSGDDAEEAADSYLDAADAIKDAVEAMKRANEDSYTASKRGFEDVYTNQKNAFDQEKTDLKNALDAAYNDRKAALDAEERQLSDAHSREYDERKSAFDSEKSLLKQALDDQYKTRSDELGREYDQQKAASDRAYKELSKRLDREYQARKSALDKERDVAKSAGADELSEMRDRHSKEESALKKSLDKRYSERKKSYDKELKELQKANEKAVKAAKDANSKQTKDFKAETDKRVKAIKAEYEERKRLVEENDGTSAIDKRIKQLEDQTKSEQRAIKLAAQEEKKAELQKAVDSAKTRRSRAEAEKALNDYLAELAQEAREEEREREIEKLEERKAQIKEETKAKQEALNSERDAEIERYEAERELQLEEMQKTQDAVIERMQADFDLQEERRREQYDLRLEGYRAALDEQYAAEQEANDREEEELAARNEKRLADVAAHNEAILSQLKEANDARLAAQKESDDLALEALKSMHQAELDLIKSNNEQRVAELAATQATELANLKSAQSAELESMKLAHQAELDDIKISNSNQITELSNAQAAMLTNLKRSQDDQLTALKRSQEDQVKEYERSLKKANDKVAEGGESINATSKSKTDAMRQMLVETLDKLPPYFRQTFENAGINLDEVMETNKANAGQKAKETSDAVVNGFDTLTQELYEKGGLAFGAFGLKGGIESQSFDVNSAVDDIRRTIDDNAIPDLYGPSQQIPTTMASGMNDASWQVGSAAQSIADAASGPLENVQMWTNTSGYNAGTNFANGLNDTFWMVADAANSLAEAVSARLHHSTPELGPMRDDDEWGDDMIMNIVNGMRRKERALATQANRMAQIVQDEFAPTTYKQDIEYDVTSATRVLTNGVTEALRNGAANNRGVTVVVNGMTVREEADINRISERLSRKVAQAGRRGL